MIKQIRINNLKSLVTEFGSVAAVARKTGKQDSQLNQILNGVKSSTGTPRGIGGKLARDLEKGCGKPEGWMDFTHSGDNEAISQQNQEVTTIDNVKRDDVIEINLLSATGSMGTGVSADLNHDEVVSNVSLSKKFINSHLGSVTSPNNIRLITGIGNSMEGVFDDGDVLFADIGVNEITSDAVYVVRYCEEIYIKNVQRVPGGGLKLISSNKIYDPIPIMGNDLKDAQVLAKIVGTWNFKKI